MATLHQIVKRDLSVFPLVGIIGAGGFALQASVLADDQAVYVSNHEGMLLTPVHHVGATDLQSGSLHETPGNVIFQVPALAHCFAIHVGQVLVGLIPIDGHRTGIRI